MAKYYGSTGRPVSAPHVREVAKIVTLARKKGHLIPQPCQACGSTRHIEAHHDDYSRPLDIIWLCASHHVKFHWARRKGSTLTAAQHYGLMPSTEVA